MTILGADPERTMKTVADAVKTGRCVLFLGSAVHAPPPKGVERSEAWERAYPEDKRPAMAGTLLERLSAASDWPQQFGRDRNGNPVEPWDLQRMSLFYEVTRSRGELVAEIDHAVSDGKEPSPIVKALAALDFPVVITTNYDLLFDRALHAVNKTPRIDLYSPNPTERLDDQQDPTVDRPFLFKMHGDVGHSDSLVITDEDYIQFVLVMNTVAQIPLTYTYHLTKWPTLFVGYSLLDYNLRLLFKTLRWGLDLAKIPRTYSVDREPDPLILNVWQNRKYVTFIAQDVWSFVPELYRRVRGTEMPA
jgi:hypothetical protein